MKKGTVIKLDDGKYQLFCKDREYLVFGKLRCHRDGSSSLNFMKTATFSALPELIHQAKERVVK